MTATRLEGQGLADKIEEQINAALTTDLPKRLWRGKLELAMDEHDEPFYGKSEELLQYACRGRAKAGTTYLFRVATLYHIPNKIPLTLAMAFVRPEDTTLAGTLHEYSTLTT